MKDKRGNKLPTIKEMVDIELSEPEISVGIPLSQKDIDQWFNSLLNRFEKLIKRQSKYMTDNNETTDCLLLFLEKYPELLDVRYDTINRDMIKWALHENIKKNRELIDKIQEVEKSQNLEIHHTW